MTNTDRIRHAELIAEVSKDISKLAAKRIKLEAAIKAAKAAKAEGA